MEGTIVIRPEERADGPAIDEVHRVAFGGPAEAALVAALRATPEFDPALSLVATADGRVVGHLLLTPVLVEGDGAARPALALAPMAVLPGWQKRGIGSGLIRAGFEAGRRRGHGAVLVVGHPAYYPRFGFVPAGTLGIRAPFEVPDEAFLARELAPDGLRGVAGTVRYPPAFAGVR
jgi:putative acetyltransferase